MAVDPDFEEASADFEEASALARWLLHPPKALPLSSSAWAQMTHSYGSAGDVPAMLIRLAKAVDESDEEAWKEEFDQMCAALRHQGDLHDVTFAVYPYLADLAVNFPDQIPDLVGDCSNYMATDLNWLDERPQLDADVRAWAWDAVAIACTWQAELLESLDGEHEGAVRLRVVDALMLRKRFSLATMIQDLDSLEIECPHCGDPFTPWLEVDDDDDGSADEAPDQMGDSSPRGQVQRELYEVCDRIWSSYPDLADRIRTLARPAECDHCEQSVDLLLLEA